MVGALGGIAWETFHTLGSIPVYGEDTKVFNHGASILPVQSQAAGSACCVPAGKTESDADRSNCCAG
jgi:hypothetical protein